jgi:PHD/YefM family antitoxin component YafN of YafNO toxin-antitoxin module
VKTNAAEMLRQINETKNPIGITQNGEARGVLIDPESYHHMRDALGMIKLIERAEHDVHAGRTGQHADVITRLSEQIDTLEGVSERPE